MEINRTAHAFSTHCHRNNVGNGVLHVNQNTHQGTWNIVC